MLLSCAFLLGLAFGFGAGTTLRDLAAGLILRGLGGICPGTLPFP